MLRPAALVHLDPGGAGQRGIRSQRSWAIWINVQLNVTFISCPRTHERWRTRSRLSLDAGDELRVRSDKISLEDGCVRVYDPKRTDPVSLEMFQNATNVFDFTINLSQFPSGIV